ncbi:hypothetical protein SLA2020_109390 [Shorea laevis]
MLQQPTASYNVALHSPTHSPSFFNIIYLINLLFFIYTDGYPKVFIRIDNVEIPPGSGSFSKQTNYSLVLKLLLHGLQLEMRGGRVSSTTDPTLPLPFGHE